MPTTLRLLTWNGKSRTIDLSQLTGRNCTGKGNLQLYFADQGAAPEELNVRVR